MPLKHLFLLILTACCPLTVSSSLAGEQGALGVGVDGNYSLGMEAEGKRWQWDGNQQELYQGIASQGVQKLRVRLWTKDEGVNGKDYATKVVERSVAAGLDPYLVIFLSEDWADLMKQPVPTAWKDLTLADRAKAVQVYSKDIVTHFRKHGLRSHLYEIGNEIDYGICGIYPGKSTKKNPESLSRKCWPEAAEIIRASQAGVMEADPEAKFLLHIAHWWDLPFCTGFFEFMLQHNVRVDYAGLSYFPSSNIGGSLEMEQFGEVASKLNAAIHRPILVPETAYPSTSDFKGQFSRWKKEVPGYPLTPDGQQRWIADFLDFCAHHPAIAEVYYWSPEWYGEGMWKAFALFDVEGQARPAWKSFARPSRGWPKPRQSVYFEAQGDSLVPMPLSEIKAKAAEALQEELKQAGRVNTDYIKAITDRELTVGPWKVNLRASLNGNLNLTLKEEVPASDAKSTLMKLDPATQQAVIFLREAKPDTERSLKSLAEKIGLEINFHPFATEKGLTFGFGQAWQEQTEEP